MASNLHAFVAGGAQNLASGRSSVVLSGNANIASGQEAIVLGGSNNTASGLRSVVINGASNVSSASGAIIMGGTSNLIGTAATNSAITSGSGNAIGDGGVSSGGSFIGAGNGNATAAIYVGIVSGLNNVASGSSAFVGAGNQNQATGNSSVLAGGQMNTSSGLSSSVGGGAQSSATGSYSVISGGFSNTASGISSVVGGGRNNDALASESTVAGGLNNEASGSYAAVIGGNNNVASGLGSSVIGGQNNLAAGTYSTAGGFNATTTGLNSFIWGKNVLASATGSVVLTDADPGNRRVFNPVNFNTPNRFFGVFAGGYALYTTQDPVLNPGAGVSLPAGATAWLSLSDRNSKTDFEEVDTVAVLEKVASMPMTTWKYKHDEETRYMGVMSQDLFGAFELGQNDTTINGLVADGVQMAAIQGLNKKLNEKLESKDSEIQGLKEKQAELEAKLDRIEKLLK